MVQNNLSRTNLRPVPLGHSAQRLILARIQFIEIPSGAPREKQEKSGNTIRPTQCYGEGRPAGFLNLGLAAAPAGLRNSGSPQ